MDPFDGFQHILQPMTANLNAGRCSANCQTLDSRTKEQHLEAFNAQLTQQLQARKAQKQAELATLAQTNRSRYDAAMESWEFAEMQQLTLGTICFVYDS